MAQRDYESCESAFGRNSSSSDYGPSSECSVQRGAAAPSRVALVNFDESLEEAEIRAEIRAFLDANATLKTGTETDWSRGPVDDSEEAARVYMERCRSWQKVLRDNGWAGITWPKAFGGRGDSAAVSILFGQEASKYDVTAGFIAAVQSLVGPPIMRHGTPEQQARFLPGLLDGSVAWCQLFSEPGAGSDLAALSTRAVRDGDSFIVNGQKVWNTQAQFADWGILITRSDPDAPKHKGITFLLVDMKTPGIEVRPLVQATGQAHFNEVFFNDVVIPVENVVGEINEGWAVTRTVLSSEAGMIGSGAGGSNGFEGVLALARKYGRTNDADIRLRLADAYARERMLQLLGLRMQSFILNGRGNPPDPSVMKNFMVQAAEKRYDLALELEGADGMLDKVDAPQNGFWQSVHMGQFGSRIGGGTNEVHRNMIAERALGLPRDIQPDKDLAWKDILKA
ncbi:MAG: acyl-CoA dehydrogenase [Actinobacteria bacterium]|nr:acyl-CoA dehydrogenase [Actinomycetota bacterium]MSY34391.1 acyl-CoA dehydrogenase [Actinomycetota bacterium]MSZ52654.1 acyl-CoA dehydrogenase [Actinomycetota bacterium]